MKRKRLLLLIIPFVLLFGCSKDEMSSGNDDLSKENLEKILGIWTFSGSSTNGTPDTITDPCRLLFNIHFAKGYASVQEYSGTDCIEVQSTSEDYSINKNTLRVGDFTAEIVTLNNTLLIITYNEGGNKIDEAYTKS